MKPELESSLSICKNQLIVQLYGTTVDIDYSSNFHLSTSTVCISSAFDTFG